MSFPHATTSRSSHAAGQARAVLVVDSTGRGHAICELFTRTNPDLVVYYGPGCELITHDRIVPCPGSACPTRAA